MNTELIVNTILLYPGMAFAAGAAILWGARYVYKLKIENDQMKSQDHWGEVRALNKIEDMHEFLEDVAISERNQIAHVEHELIDRQIATIGQKNTLTQADQIMQASIDAAETYHDDVLTHFEEIEERLAEYDDVNGLVNVFQDLKVAYDPLKAQQGEVVDLSLAIQQEIKTTEELARQLAWEVGA